MKRRWLAATPGAGCGLALVALVAVAQPDAEKVAADAMVYADYCANCHGDQLRHTSGGVTLRSPPAALDRP